MNQRTKLELIILSLIILASFGLSLTALAAPKIMEGAEEVGKVAGYETKVSETAVSETVGRIIKIVMSLTGVIFLGLTVYGGVLWMTAAGSEEKVGKAVSIFRASIIGLIIIVFSFSITLFISSQLIDIKAQQTTTGFKSDAGFWKGFMEGFSKQWSTWYQQ